MGNSSKKRYDNKHKVTRIFLADYLVLKGYARQAGVSMAEALHTIITRDWAMARSVTKPVSQPAFRVTAPVTIATNGGKLPAFRIKAGGVTAFRIKPRGARYD